MVFYDRNGDPVAYTDDGEYVYLFNGSAVGHLVRDSVYAYDGTHLGWFIDGWIRDHDGYCVYFTDGAQGGPVKPKKTPRPPQRTKEMPPIPGVRDMKPMNRPDTSLAWSSISGLSFFLRSGGLPW